MFYRLLETDDGIKTRRPIHHYNQEIKQRSRQYNTTPAGRLHNEDGPYKSEFIMFRLRQQVEGTGG